MAVRYQGGKAVEANSASDRAAKAMLLQAQSAINKLRSLDLPRDLEALVIQLDEKVMEHGRELKLRGVA